MASKILKDYIDESIDPCKDFYQFSCGTWLKKNHLKSKKLDVQSFHQSILDIRKTFFDQFITGKKVIKSRILQQIKYFNKLCMIKYIKVHSYKTAFDRCNWEYPKILDDPLYYIMLHYTYDEKEFHKIKLKVFKMIDNIKYSFKKLINEKTWIDEVTKKFAIKKLNHMSNKFFDIKNYTLKEMEILYRDLKFIKEDTYDKAIKSLKTWDIVINKKKKSLKKLPIDKLFHPNAFYTLTKNSISYYWGILTKPFFDDKLPMSFNYGGLGSIIGHEMVHGFDNDGSKYDENGKKFNWWSDGGRKNFTLKSNSFVKQYSKNIDNITGFNVDGNLTLSENIADNCGVKVSFNGYKKYLQDLGKNEPKIPGYEKYSNEQLFFIAYTQLYCSSLTFFTAYNLIVSDSHTPDRIRVFNTLGNQKSFGETFKCKIGDPMNPKNKYEVWR